MQFKELIRLTCAFGAISAASPALAQQAESGGIGDVVVTAQKRATNLQDTPIAITAVSQDTLERQGVYQITDITRVAPEIKVQPGLFSVLQIRGVRTGQFGPTADSPNAVHIDGNYMARMIGLNGYFYDLERVEVVAGPQGTLYGRNSVGGSMNIISRKPELGKFGGSVSADIGNYNQLVLNGAINLPIGDDLAIRVAGMRNSRDGFYTDTNGFATDLQGYRVSARWAPGERDTITVTGDYQRDQGGVGNNPPITKVYRSPNIASSTAAATLGSASVVNFGATCDASNNCSVVPILATDDIWHNRNVTANDYNIQRVETDGYAVQWDHDFDFATLTAQASYRTMDLFARSGQVAGGAQDPRLRASGVLGNRPGINNQQSTSEWNTQEIRLVSNDADQETLKYTIGVNHLHEKVYSFNGALQAGWYANNSATNPGAQIGALVLPVGADGVPIGNAPYSANAVWTDAFAVFGEATYTPSGWDALHLTLGARYNWEDKHGINANTTAAIAGRSYNYFPYPATGQVVCPTGTLAFLCGPVVLQYTQYDETRQFERATYKGSIQYDLTDSNMVYATYSTGFVSGGYVFGVPQTGNLNDPNHSYDPMSIVSYEVGAKNRFFDNRLQVNVSAYHYDFKNYLSNQNLQIPNPPPNGTAQNFFRSAVMTAANAGDTEFEGATFDFQFLLTENDSFHLNGQYTEAEISFDLAQLYFDTTKAGLASQGYNSSDACTRTVMTGSPTGAATSGSIAGAIAANCPTPPGGQNLAAFFTTPLYSGNAFPGDFNPSGSFERPKWELNADYTHTFNLPSATLDAQVAWHYTGRGADRNGIIVAPVNLNRVIPAGFTNTLDFAALQANAPFRIPEKDTWDLSFRYQRDNANWSITAYVRNVLDDENLSTRVINSNLTGYTSINLDTLQVADINGNITNNGAAGASTLNYLYLTETYDPPRTFGVVFNATF